MNKLVFIMEELLTAFIENQPREIIDLAFDVCLDRSWKQIDIAMSSILAKNKNQCKMNNLNSMASKQFNKTVQKQHFRSRILSEGDYSKQGNTKIISETKDFGSFVNNAAQIKKSQQAKESQNQQKVSIINDCNNHIISILHKKSFQQKLDHAFQGTHNKKNIQKQKAQANKMKRNSFFNLYRKTAKSSLQSKGRQKQQLNTALKVHSLEKKIVGFQKKQIRVKQQVRKILEKSILVNSQKLKLRKICEIKLNLVNKVGSIESVKIAPKQTKAKSMKINQNQRKYLLKYSKDTIYFDSNKKFAYQSKSPFRVIKLA